MQKKNNGFNAFFSESEAEIEYKEWEKLPPPEKVIRTSFLLNTLGPAGLEAYMYQFRQKDKMNIMPVIADFVMDNRMTLANDSAIGMQALKDNTKLGQQISGPAYEYFAATTLGVYGNDLITREQVFNASWAVYIARTNGADLELNTGTFGDIINEVLEDNLVPIDAGTDYAIFRPSREWTKEQTQDYISYVNQKEVKLLMDSQGLTRLNYNIDFVIKEVNKKRFKLRGPLKGGYGVYDDSNVAVHDEITGQPLIMIPRKGYKSRLTSWFEDDAEFTEGLTDDEIINLRKIRTMGRRGN